jgi:hypothetical protein
VIIDSGSRNHVNNSPLYCSVVQRACGCLNRRDLPALEAHGGNGVGVGTGPAPASGFLRGYKLREVEAAYVRLTDGYLGASHPPHLTQDRCCDPETECILLVD